MSGAGRHVLRAVATAAAVAGAAAVLWWIASVACETQGAQVMAEPERFADGVPASARRVLTDLYADAGRRIAEMVVRPTGRTFSARQFTRARAAALIAQIGRIRADVGAATVRWAGGAAARAYGLGLNTAVEQLRAAGLADRDIPVRGSLGLIDRRTVAVIAADMAAGLDAALGDQAASAQRFLRAAAQTIVPDAEVSRVVARGAVTGDVRQAVRDMRGLLNADRIEDYRRAGRQLVQVGRATLTVAAYAEMLVVTRTREATVHARHERLLANGRDLVSIVGRISVNFCTAYLGRVFSITGRDRRYPALAELPGGGPPFHPRCSKSTRAYVEEFASDAQRRQAAMTDRRLVTTDAAAAQRVFDRKGELHNVARRYGPTTVSA